MVLKKHWRLNLQTGEAGSNAAGPTIAELNTPEMRAHRIAFYERLVAQTAGEYYDPLDDYELD
ncbi:MAG: hypothetical protein WDZ93_01985 [Candidatus Paceibacterota bacterium]